MLKSPRQYLQLSLPLALLAAGWITLAFGAHFAGLGLMATAAVAAALLVWNRTRVVQRRVDRASGHLTRLGGAPLYAPATQINPDAALPDVDVLAALALSAGLAPGFAVALRAVNPQPTQLALLAVPQSVAHSASNWAMHYHPASWVTVTPADGELARNHAPALDVVVISDPGEAEPYSGVLDQSFFWWLPPACRVLLVAADPAQFAQRLSATHQVQLGVAPLGAGCAEAVVLRPED